MAMSRSFRDNGSDEVRDQVSDICCFCANNDHKIQQASHFCYECGDFGRFLCGTCLRRHNSFLGNHDVTHIGSQANSRNEFSRTKALLEKHAQEVTASKEECTRLGKIIREKNEALHKNDGEVKRLMNEIKVIKSQLDTSKDDIHEKQAVVNDLAKMLAKSNSENEKLTSQIKELLTEQTKLEAEITKRGDTIKKAAAEKSVLEGNIEKLKKYKETPNRDNLRKFDYLPGNKYSDVIEEMDDLNTRKPVENVTMAMQQQLQQQVNCGTYKKGILAVAAIDFGTAFSTYAFSFKHDYEADPSNITCNMHWKSGLLNVSSLKAPTVVLFDENKKFHSFGYQAEYTYEELGLDDKHHKWFFFKGFKKRLYDKKITRDTKIEDDKGRKMKALDVFGAVIKYLKDRLLDLFRTRGTWVQIQQIHWVLTVPAIWSDSSKQFMREAAYKAGIDGSSLSIASEPEAATLYCQIVPTDKLHGTKGVNCALATPGTKHMVINVDETVDITVHERHADGGLRELYKASVVDLGGNQVDEEFYGLLISIIGGPVYQKFVDENKADHLDLQRELKIKKLTITPQSNGKITIKVPQVIANTYKDEMKKDIKDAIEGSPYSGKITWNGDKMRIDAQIFKNIFKSWTDKIVSHITGILRKSDVQGTNIFLMVGEFSQSVMVQDAIMKALPKGKFIIPDEAGLTVLKGAVIFGHRSVAITSRESRYTYGIIIFPAFDSTIHPEDHRVSVGGIYRCRDVFKKYIHKGEMVRVGEVRSSTHVTLKSSQQEMVLKVIASPKKDPMFVDEDDTEYLGKVVVSLPVSEDKIRVEVKMMFGETELIVEAMELSQHTKYRAYFA